MITQTLYLIFLVMVASSLDIKMSTEYYMKLGIVLFEPQTETNWTDKSLQRTVNYQFNW